MTHKPNGSGLTRLVRATECSMKGIASAWRDEAAFRQECVLAVILIPVALWLGETPLEISLLISSLLLLLVVESLNSAVEAAIDRIGPEHHPLSAKAKDLGSAAVFFTMLIIAVLWIPFFWQKITPLL
ncbi:diacylglycerol kinase [Aestuariibacter salexigens]|uniref:diacylglycerol kinase n=1 Tax=Aestuariibacter salexigens TaxID=226010 RepID=UPI00047C09CD|nr:diacylglycerol kinase [Aestuariibacter salexigens]